MHPYVCNEDNLKCLPRYPFQVHRLRDKLAIQDAAMSLESILERFCPRKYVRDPKYGFHCYMLAFLVGVCATSEAILIVLLRELNLL